MTDRTPEDAEWERIVSSLRGPDTTGSTEWPHASADDAAGEKRDPEPPASADEPVIIWRGSDADVDAEIERAVPDEHFVPPEPPPLPRADAITWAAWLAVVGAPLLLLLLSAVGVSSGLVATVLVAAFVAGIAVLVTRMRTQRDPFDPDDGAVV